MSPIDPEAEPAGSGPVEVDPVDDVETLAAESLNPGQKLWRGDVVRSANRQYRLVMQEDGNLVLYFKRRALWSSGTAGHPRAHAVMQADGNLVVYAPNRGPALWSSGTSGHPGAFLAVQTDANVVVYSPQRVALWSSASFNNRLESGERLKPGFVLYSPTRAVRATMQADGNLVVYGGNRALWNAGTVGHPGAYAAMQPDGNLVVYSKAGRALWSSGTDGHANARLALQGDGNLVVYPPSGPAVWNAQSFVDRLPAGRGLAPGQFLVSDSGAHTLHMQGDGNLVVYAGGQAVWSTGTDGHPGAHLEMQGDGNLVVYPPSGAALWSSNTAGNGGAQLFMQSDANLVIYAGGRAVWSRIAPPPPNSGVIGDNYPEPWRSAPLDAYIDTWRYYSRECTSFVAWRLHSTNGYEMPRAIGNAGVWGSYFRARGVRVDNTPARGAIAENAGHVAWVAVVNGNGTITIEEYNVPGGSGRYSVRTVPASSFHYIHVKDL